MLARIRRRCWNCRSAQRYLPKMARLAGLSTIKPCRGPYPKGCCRSRNNSPVTGSTRGKAFAHSLYPFGISGHKKRLLMLLGGLLLTLSAFASDPENKLSFEVVSLHRDQTFCLQGTAIEITALEIKGPREDCHDCPLGALLQLRMGNQEEIVKYRFSGNMPEEAHKKARQKRVFGYVFTMRSITADSITFDVVPDAGASGKTGGRKAEEK